MITVDAVNLLVSASLTVRGARGATSEASLACSSGRSITNRCGACSRRSIGGWSAGKLAVRERMSNARVAAVARAHPVLLNSKVAGLVHVAKTGASGEPSWKT